MKAATLEHITERVVRLETQAFAIAEDVKEIKQGIRDLNLRMDKFMLWVCSYILGTFLALSAQLWLKR